VWGQAKGLQPRHRETSLAAVEGVLPLRALAGVFPLLAVEGHGLTAESTNADDEVAA
jgi:hypothetical protein